jgi:hypothetical protein
VEDRVPGIGTVEGVYIDEREELEELAADVGEELDPEHPPPRDDPAFIGETPVPPVEPLDSEPVQSAQEDSADIIDIDNEPRRQES